MRIAFSHCIYTQLPQHVPQRGESVKSVVSYSSTVCVANSESSQSMLLAIGHSLQYFFGFSCFIMFVVRYYSNLRGNYVSVLKLVILACTVVSLKFIGCSVLMLCPATTDVSS